jgi:hypothetical protein
MKKMTSIEQALAIIEQYGMTDGTHHKQWVLDQVARALTGDGYSNWVKEMNQPGYEPWDEGIAP